MKYSEYIDKSYERLEEAEITVEREHLDKLEEERVTNKALLNTVLELTPENNYRKTMDISLTESQIRKVVPETVKFIERIILENYGSKVTKFSIVKNKIYSGKKTYLKLSKVLTRELSKCHDGYQVTNRLVYNLYELSRNEINCYNGVNDYVSILIDMVKPKNIVISTNIYDMLTSSTDTVYSSCYSMYEGQYFNGNLSYIRDSFTCITFVHAGDIHRKIGRSWAYVFPKEFKLAMPGNPYGSMYKPEYMVIRKYIERQISKYHDVKPYWKFIPNVKYDNSRLYSGHESPVYFDYSKVGMAYHQRKTDDKAPFLKFIKARCLSCGKITGNLTSGLCSDCEGGDYCADCEEYIDGEYFVTQNGNHVCSYCFENNYDRCSYCNNLHYVDDLTETGNDNHVCEYCLSSRYTECSECNEYFPNDDINHTDNYGCVCSECLEAHYIRCEECGGVLHESEGNESDDNKIFCDECYEKIEEEVCI